MEHAEKMPLKTFWEAVEQRLAASSADELRAILRTMAHEVRPSDRRAFLARLGSVEEMDVALSQAAQPGDLLADIDDLAHDLEDTMQHADVWEDRYDGEDYYDEEDSLGLYEEFVEPLTGLYNRTQATFDRGDVGVARAAYRKLFELLGFEDDYGRGVSASDLTGVDAGEAAARYLRAVYESESAQRRPQALYEQMHQVHTWLGDSRPMLDDLVQISPRPLSDREQFLTDWIAFLREQSAPSGSDADAWLREAVRLAQGTPGLEALARAEGQTRPRAYLDWLTALEQEGRYQEVLAAAQEALQALPARLPIRAAIADHLCTAALSLDEVSAMRQGRWEAFAAKPILPRLLDLWKAVAGEEERTALMQRALQHTQDYAAHPPDRPDEVLRIRDDLERPAWVTPLVLAHACLLAGDWDAAHHLAAQGKVLGWSSSESAQGLVVSAYLVLLSGRTPGTLPPNLGQLWQWAMRNSIDAWGWTGEREDLMHKRLELVYAEHLAHVRWTADQQGRFLAWCLDVAQQRVNAIVGDKHRGSYDKAAVLAVACAEVLRLREDKAAADALIGAVRNRFPRHRAFQAEMKSALRQMERGL
jgi:tetratricopeptide (TPR) repeat protein